MYALLYFIDQQCLASLVLISWGPRVFALFSWSMVSKKWRVGEFSLTDVEDAARSLPRPLLNLLHVNTGMTGEQLS